MVAEIVIDVGAQWWTLLVGLGIPVLVAALGRIRGSKTVKGVLAIVASAITGIVASVSASKGVVSDDALTGFAITYGSQLAAYLGFWKPVVGLNDRVAPDNGEEGTSGEVIDGEVPEEFA